MAHSLPVKVRRTEFASSDPDELREVIDRGFGSRLQLAVPRRRGWRATVSQVDAGYFTSTDTRLPADLTFTNDGHDDSFVIDTLLDGDISIDRGGTACRFGPGGTFLGFTPTAGVLALSSWVDSHKDTVQKVVDAIVATMHWLSTHSAADVANVLPPSFVNNSLVTKPVYISTLATDKTQFLPDGMMPADGPNIIMAISKLAGVITGPVDLSKTYTNSFVTTANKDLGNQG